MEKPLWESSSLVIFHGGRTPYRYSKRIFLAPDGPWPEPWEYVRSKAQPIEEPPVFSSMYDSLLFRSFLARKGETKEIKEVGQDEKIRTLYVEGRGSLWEDSEGNLWISASKRGKRVGVAEYKNRVSSFQGILISLLSPLSESEELDIFWKRNRDGIVIAPKASLALPIPLEELPFLEGREEVSKIFGAKISFEEVRKTWPLADFAMDSLVFIPKADAVFRRGERIFLAPDGPWPGLWEVIRPKAIRESPMILTELTKPFRDAAIEYLKKGEKPNLIHLVGAKKMFTWSQKKK